MFHLKLIIFSAFCIVSLLALDHCSDMEFHFHLEDVSTPSFGQIGKKSYLIEVEQKVNWYEAAHICRTYKSQLASIESPDEMEALSKYLKDNGHGKKWLWVSGNDLIAEGSFSWLGTGNSMRYARWQSGKPDNAGNFTDCVNMWISDNDNSFSLNDYNCKEKSFYICEKGC